MKKLITILSISLLTLSLYSQKLKKTYYDEYTQRNLMEEYYVNSAGYGNGLYKKYTREGGLLYQGTYKDGAKNGEWITYSSYTGKLEVAQKETFKEDVLNGSAIYYAGDGSYKGRFIKEQGSYLNGEKQGKWIYINSFSTYGMPDEWKAKAQYIQFVKYYEKGKEVYPDGEIIIYYLPSKQPYSVIIYKDGKETGEPKGYFPDGSIASEKMYDADGKLLFEKNYHPNGQLKGSVDWRSGKRVYEGYNEDGSPDKTMLIEKERNDQLVQGQIRRAKINQADSLLFIGSFKEALVLYDEANVNTTELEKFELLYNSHDSKKNTFESFEGQYKALKTDQMSQKHIEYCQWIFGDMKSNYEKQLLRANEIMSAGYFEEALLAYTEMSVSVGGLKKFQENLNSYKNSSTTIHEFQNEFNCCIRPYLANDNQKTYCESVLKREKGENIEIAVYSELVQNYYNSFDSIFILKPTSTGEVKETYLKGKILFLKSKIVFDSYIKEFILAKYETDKTNTELKIKNAIQTLSKIPESEWKDLNKQLKKVDDPEQIKAILKI